MVAVGTAVVTYSMNVCCPEPRDSGMALALGKLRSGREAKALMPQQENRAVFGVPWEPPREA